MRFLSKLFKFIRNIYFVVFSLIGILLTSAVGAFGYISWKTDIIDNALGQIVEALNDASNQTQGALDLESVTEMVSNFREKLPEIGEPMFIAAVVIVSIFVGTLILGGIFSLLSKKNKKGNK